ncbi:putative membrane protein [Deinobacterium chartae]|uniref:Putative membrane protein n=1 Tax=Deinobacterium chartae TaxID=521158 RepID=A0A841I290_9DEIO|nr:YibE/F family protein [Deinobacterium chartae]MBB6098499.1 putative membrane protein [Deinobacterium chartae]
MVFPRYSTRFVALLAVLAALLLSFSPARAQSDPQQQGRFVEGQVLEVLPGERLRVRLEGREVEVRGDPRLPLKAGEALEVYATTDPDGTPVYYASDYVRRPVLYLLTAVFVVIAAVVGRGKGLRAVAGMGLSLAVILAFVIPAVLAGWNPVVVALAGSAAILLLSVYFVHGFNWTTSAALLGTLGTAALTVLLAQGVAVAARLSGLIGDEALYIQQLGLNVDLRALLLAGVIIGALGALVDSTVPQAAVVRELAHLQPQQNWRELYRSSMRVGLDHIGSLINTLVLAYAGSNLPLFVVFSLGHTSWTRAINTEIIATALVQSLVGSIGLILAVPLTSLIAALAFQGNRLPAPKEGELHHHHHPH